ncbi:MAG TPA: alpha-glucan family phosphorylase [Actinomycetota bacterium]|nr:alpha-glucan family phosphorylase [Actinomycetota bacterium]
MSQIEDRNLRRTVENLASRLPIELRSLAEIAYNFEWSWLPGGREMFRDIAPLRWSATNENPVQFLIECSGETLDRAVRNGIGERADAIVERIRADCAAPLAHANADASRPVAFLCTEFAVHRSLPIYAGGLGVLAGDILKEASDMRLPLAGVGLLYRQGYFRQRFDSTGWQHEYWSQLDPELVAATLIRGEDGKPVAITVPIRGRDVVVQIWRVQVGRIPLYLLDAWHPANSAIDRWITSRLYVGDRRYRFAQYALLGIGGVRALRALGLDPLAFHMNEGHAALAPLEIARAEIEAGEPFEAALKKAKSRMLFTTHTPVPAGNEAYTAHEVLEAIGTFPAALGVDDKDLLSLGRANPDDDDEPFGLTPLGLKLSRHANGVSRRHGIVAREMWHHMYPERGVEGVPIGHVTNGVHVATWLAAPMRDLLDKHLGEDWQRRIDDPATWEPVDDIPDEELWDVRLALRANLIEYARERATQDRLSRGEPIEYAEAASTAMDPNALTIGFARRAASYKRLYLLMLDQERALRFLQSNPVQLLIAGKPHPSDEEGKRIVQSVFGLKWAPLVGQRVAYLQDYHLGMASLYVAGSDVWVNLPRPPLEASGTSGMKAAVNGCLNVSVLDGWWEEGCDGTNGWGIASHGSGEAQDIQDATALFDVLENQVLPLFLDRDERGIPRGWVQRIKNSLRTCGPRFSAARMMGEYASLYGLRDV